MLNKDGNKVGLVLLCIPMQYTGWNQRFCLKFLENEIRQELTFEINAIFLP